jgi:hypothetical protein
MSDDDKIKTAEAIELMREIQALNEKLNLYIELVSKLHSDVNDIGLRMKRLERPKMTNDEALTVFDVLKRTDASLTLPSFAAQHGLNYEALRKARLRKQKRDRDKSQ